MSEFVRWLHVLGEEHAAVMGGKGAGLGRLVRLGLPVPPGFVLTTRAYRAFITAAGLEGAAAETLRERIPVAPMPETVRDRLPAAYAGLGPGPVAVRSSGTTEDTETASAPSGRCGARAAGPAAGRRACHHEPGQPRAGAAGRGGAPIRCAP